MKLKSLLKHLPQVEVFGSKEVEISGICSDSRRIAPGNLFIARRGLTHDGTQFIPSALAAGACVIAADLYDPSLKGVTQLIADDIHALEADIAKAYYADPSQELHLIGITGTDGKTTTSFLVKHLLDALGMPCGLVGTIEHVIGKARYSATLTTPDVVTNHKVLREMVRNGCHAAVMEVSSHALDQGRVKHLAFDVGVFTNLSPEHLDYHKTMEAYFEAKLKLFEQTKCAVVNVDDRWGAKIDADITFAIDRPADLRATNIRLAPTHTEFDLLFRDETYPVHVPLIGRFNIYNVLAALATTTDRLEEAIEALKSLPQIPGRLEAVPNTHNRHIFIDFAHTPGSLKNVLTCLKELSHQRVITVFGCGGDRDKEKRAPMGQIAAELSDFAFVTSDNPRTEEPAAICQQIVADLKERPNWEIVVDRKSAIEQAVAKADPDDIILIAGRGHETSQDFGTHAIPFNDMEVAREICRTL